MTDFLQILVDRDATPESASGHAEKVLTWMQSNGVVETLAASTEPLVAWARERGLTLHETVGWSPGPRYAEWVDDLRTTQTRSLMVNLFSFAIGRQVHAVASDDLDRRCPSGHVGDGDAVMAAVGEWFEGADPSLRCPRCDRGHPIADWDLGPGMCLGLLSFRFENWGVLTPALVRELVELLAPHRTKLITGTNL